MNTNKDIRWHQRFNNYKQAILLLKEACDEDLNGYNDLEKEGLIQRFEFTLELAWKVLKDRMEYDSITLDIVSPKSIIREAYISKYINNPEIWFDMIDSRNSMSHVYDRTSFDEIVQKVKMEYVNVLHEFYLKNAKLVNQK